MTEHLRGVGYLEDTDVNDQGVLINPEIQSTIPTILMIYASWCHYCKDTLPVVQSFVDQNKGNINVLAIQADDERPSVKALASRLKSTYPQFAGYPTFIYYKNKKPTKKQLKQRTLAGLEEFAFN